MCVCVYVCVCVCVYVFVYGRVCVVLPTTGSPPLAAGWDYAKPHLTRGLYPQPLSLCASYYVRTGRTRQVI